MNTKEIKLEKLGYMGKYIDELTLEEAKEALNNLIPRLEELQKEVWRLEKQSFENIYPKR